MSGASNAADLERNINIPWPCKGMGDADYMYAFQHIVMPVAFDFNPDLVLGTCDSNDPYLFC